MKGKESLERLNKKIFNEESDIGLYEGFSLSEDINTIKAELDKLDKIKAIAEEANTHERTKINKIMKVLEE